MIFTCLVPVLVYGKEVKPEDNIFFMVLGTRGFVAWLEAGVYMRIREACKNIFVRMCVHAVGLVLIIVGLYFLIATMPSMTSVTGLFLGIIGLFIFVIPLGIE